MNVIEAEVTMKSYFYVFISSQELTIIIIYRYWSTVLCDYGEFFLELGLRKINVNEKSYIAILL